MKAPREKLLYTVALYIGTGIQKPDYLATIDADPDSPSYSQVISRLDMPGIVDEPHHMGWNACSSCHGDATKERRHLIVPGVRSSNLHIVDCATDPSNPRLHKVPRYRPMQSTGTSLQCCESLAAIQRPVDMVQVFRTSEAAYTVTEEAMKIGVRNDYAARLAEAAGLKAVMNRCPKSELLRPFWKPRLNQPI